MSKNVGKIFEKDFSDSISSQHFIHRLKDSAQAYNNSKNTSFTWENPCDFFILDTNSRLLYAVECKSTKYKSMSVQIDKNKKNKKDKKMIKYHQIESLTKFENYKYVVPCFILNFRDEKNDMERTYFIHINNFNKMMTSTGKKSFNEIDLCLNGAIRLQGKKKRIHYKWDIDELFEKVSNMSF